MNRNISLKRRDFLCAAGTAGVLGWLAAASGINASAAAANSSGGPSPAEDRLEPLLRRISSEFPTAAKEEAQFLNMLIKLSRAQRVLEIGTAYGYTTLWLALALAETGGRLTTIEIAPERAELAKKHVTEAGLSKHVSFRLGDAHAIVPALRGSFDIAYLDADKGGNEDYFNKLFPKLLPPGGLLIAHNAIQLVAKMKSYLDLVGRHPDFETLIISAIPDDGLALSCRKRAKR